MTTRELADTLGALDPDYQRLVMAFGIVLDRVRRLSQEDSDDLFEIFKNYREASTVEERRACDGAIMEILGQEPVRVRRMTLASNDEDTPEVLESWLEYVSRQIRKLRREAGWTQTRLAEASGLPQSHISRIENGKHSPSRMTLEKIAGALDVPLSGFDPGADAQS